MKNLRNIELKIEAKGNLKTLEAANRNLAEMTRHLDAINSRLSGLTSHAALSRNVNQLATALKKLGPGHTLDQAAERLGYSKTQTNDILGFVKNQHEQITQEVTKANSRRRAAEKAGRTQELAEIEKHLAALRDRQKAYQNAFSTTGTLKGSVMVLGDWQRKAKENANKLWAGIGNMLGGGGAVALTPEMLSALQAGAAARGGGTEGGGGKKRKRKLVEGVASHTGLASKTTVVEDGLGKVVKEYLTPEGKVVQTETPDGGLLTKKTITENAKTAKKELKGRLRELQNEFKQQLGGAANKDMVGTLLKNYSEQARALMLGTGGDRYRAYQLGDVVEGHIEKSMGGAAKGRLRDIDRIARGQYAADSEFEKLRRAGLKAGKAEQEAEFAGEFAAKKKLDALKAKNEAEQAAAIERVRRAGHKAGKTYDAGEASAAAMAAKKLAAHKAEQEKAQEADVAGRVAEEMRLWRLRRAGQAAGGKEAGVEESEIAKAKKKLEKHLQKQEDDRLAWEKKNPQDAHITARQNEMKRAAAEAKALRREQEALSKQTQILSGDFITNTAKVTAWTASVAALYQGLNLVASGMRSMTDTQAQMARLDQVFTGVGGTTKELAKDILGLAAANGRSAKEALDSAVQWSRLGLTKKQVNEAVRVSLIAANVAELDAAQATEHLQAIMLTYKLQVGQLSTVLGELNEISNTYRVTNADMLQGISRTSAVAKMAGLGLQELMGVIAGGVAKTGQSGANIGNAVKALIQGAANPALQQTLRSKYGIQTSAGGEMLPFRDILAGTWARYQQMAGGQQRMLLQDWAGKQQGSRMAALLDSYVEGQVKAIHAQLNLNSAQEENTKITATLKSNLAGLTAEWERFAMLQGSHGPLDFLTEITKAMKGVLALMNTPGGSTITTLFGGLFAAGMARTALAGMGSGKDSMMGRTGAKVIMAAQNLNDYMARSMSQMHAGQAASALAWQGAPPWWLGRSPTAGRIAGDVAMGVGRGIGGIYNFGQGRVEAAERMNVAMKALNATVGNTAKVFATAFAGLTQFFKPLLLIAGGVWVFNRAMEGLRLTTGGLNEELDGLNTRMEKARSAAEAYAQAGRLIATAQEAMRPGKRGEMSQQAKGVLLEQLADVMFVDDRDPVSRERKRTAYLSRVAAARASGDLSGMGRELEMGRRRMGGARLEELQSEFSARAQQKARLQYDIAIAEDMNKAGIWGVGRRTRTLDENRAKLAEIVKLEGQQRGEMETILDAESRTLEYSSEHLTVLERQRETLRQISEIYGAVPAHTPLGRNLVGQAEAAAKLGGIRAMIEQRNAEAYADNEGNQARLAEKDRLQKELDAKRAEMDSMEMSFLGGMTRGDLSKMVGKDITFEEILGRMPSTMRGRYSDKRAEVDALQQTMDSRVQMAGGSRLLSIDSNRAELMRQLPQAEAELAKQRAAEENARQITRFGRGQEAGRREIGASGYGLSETDKILRERQAATKMAADLAGKTKDDLLAQGKLVAALNSQYERTVDLKERQHGIEREILQMQADLNKEAMKGFFGAGPAEMLRKLAAFRMSRQNLSQGQFFGMSAEMRGEVGQFNGNWNPDMRLLLRERELNRRGQRGMGIGGEAGYGATLDGLSKSIASAVADVTKSFSNDRVIGPLEQAMQTFNVGASEFGRAADIAAKVMMQVAAVFAGGNGGRIPAQSGYALFSEGERSVSF